MKLPFSIAALKDTARLLVAGAVGGLMVHQCETPRIIEKTEKTVDAATAVPLNDEKYHSINFEKFEATTVDKVKVVFNMHADYKGRPPGGLEESRLRDIVAGSVRAAIAARTLKDIGAENALKEVSGRFLSNPMKDFVQVTFRRNLALEADCEKTIAQKIPRAPEPKGTIVANDINPVIIWMSEMSATIPVAQPL